VPCRCPVKWEVGSPGGRPVGRVPPAPRGRLGPDIATGGLRGCSSGPRQASRLLVGAPAGRAVARPQVVKSFAVKVFRLLFLEFFTPNRYNLFLSSPLKGTSGRISATEAPINIPTALAGARGAG
jgi:hypothetical protein